MKIYCSRIFYFLLFIIFFSTSVRAQKIEGLALTPPMGWNSWNTFQTKISEQLVKDIADKMVKSGMRDAGYTYLVLDDGWMAMDRDKNGDLIPDPIKFPNGIKAVAAYVHSKGLKFGLYNCAGTKTCAGYPGTRGYEYQDARFYAAADIDYLKFDWCYADGQQAIESYTTMSKALAKTGKPIVFSLCEWGNNKPWHWAVHVGHLWRTTGDIGVVFDGSKKLGDWTPMSAMRILDFEDSLRNYAGPGHWNDPDMLEVGKGFSSGEDRAHFSMWCMLAAPLMAGNDLRTMSVATTSVLANKAVIEIDQDKLGIQAYRLSKKDSLETWMKPLTGGSWAVCFLNRSKNDRPVDIDWALQGFTDTLSHRIFNSVVTQYKIKDLWKNKNLVNTTQKLKTIIPAHDVLVLRLDLLKS